MKIAHLVPNFPPEFRGGIESYVEALVTSLARLGFEQVVIAGSEVRRAEGEGGVEGRGGVRVVRLHRLPDGENYSVDFQLPRLGPLFEAALRRERPDAAHLHHWFNLGSDLVWRCHRLAIPCVVTLHDVFTTCPRFFRVVGGRFCEQDFAVATCGACISGEYLYSFEDLRLEILVRDLEIRRELGLAARIVAPSQSLADFIRGKLPGLPPIDVVPHGVLRALPRLQYKPPEQAGEPFWVGTWGNIVEAKGLHVLVDAMQAVARTRVSELHLFGECPDAAYGARLRAGDGAGVLRLHGPFDPVALPGLARGLHVAVFPSLCFESFSLVLEEALALGLPVVVSDRGALPERVGDGGCVVAAGRADLLAGVLTELARDPERLRRMSRAAASRSSITEAAGRLAAIYEEAIGLGLPVPDSVAIWRPSLHAREDPGADVRDLEAIEGLLRRLRASYPRRIPPPVACPEGVE